MRGNLRYFLRAVWDGGAPSVVGAVFFSWLVMAEFERGKMKEMDILYTERYISNYRCAMVL